MKTFLWQLQDGRTFIPFYQLYIFIPKPFGVNVFQDDCSFGWLVWEIVNMLFSAAEESKCILL